MEFLNRFILRVVDSFGDFLPRMLWALVILLLGWIVALVAAKFVIGVCKKLKLDPSLGGDVGEDGIKVVANVPLWLSRLAYYLILAITLVGFFEVLDFQNVTEPFARMVGRVLEFLPNLIAGGMLMVVGWIVAKLMRAVFIRSAQALKLDEKVADGIESQESQSLPVVKTVGDVIYWLVLLLFLPFILEKLKLVGLLGPVQEMWTRALSVLPRIVAAGVVMLCGWFVAVLLRKITTNLAASVGVDSLCERVGVSRVFGKSKVSGIIGMVVYVLVIINVLVFSLEQLNITNLTQPFINVLDQVYAAVPQIMAAAGIMVIAYVVAAIVSDLCANLMSNLGGDSLLVTLGLTKSAPEGDATPSKIVAKLVMVGIVFFGAVTAAERLGFYSLVGMGNQFLAFAGRVLFGLLILAIGIFLSNLASSSILATKGDKAGAVAFVCRVVVLVFSGALALQHVVPESQIVVLGFMMVGGAAAVAIAIAFGVGGRDLAARKLDEWSKAISGK